MTTIPTLGAATVSSLEIAELTGKRHDHVMRDIRVMLEALGGLPNFGDTHCNPQNGQSYPIFRLPYDETITLVAGYDAALRFKIVKRWSELEQAKPALPNFANPAKAARAWAERYEGEQKVLAQPLQRPLQRASDATEKRQRKQ